MKKLIYLLIIFCLISILPTYADLKRDSKVVSIVNDAVVISGEDCSAASFQLQTDMSWDGTITFQATTIGNKWVTIKAINANTEASSTTATSDGIYIVPIGGFNRVRAYVSAIMAGSAVLTGQCGSGQNAALVSGSVTASGTVNCNSGTNLNTSLLATESTLSSLNSKVTLVDTTMITVSISLPAGTALLGKIGIDQTTPGTTNGVAIAQIGSNTIDTGVGTAGTGTQRVAVASDSSITCNAGANLNTSFLATSLKQDTGNTSLSSIDGKITACNTGAVTVSSLPNVAQPTHDNLNLNANIQVGDTDVGNANPVPVNVVSGSAADVQYTEGDTDASITGNAILWEDAGNVLATVSASMGLPVNVIAGSTAGTEYTEGDIDLTISGPAILGEGPSDTLTPVMLNASNQVTVSVDNNPSLGASSAAIGKLAANDGVDIGDVTLNNTSVTVSQSTASNLKVDLSGTGANSTAIKVDGSAVTQPVSGTVTCNAGTGTLNVKPTDGTNAITKTFDNDSGAGTEYNLGVTLRKSASGGSVEVGTSNDPWRVDPTGTTVQPVAGNVAHGATDSGNPEKIGYKAQTTSPTAVSDGQRVDAWGDPQGRGIIELFGPSALETHSLTTITSSTSETTILSAGASGVFHDLVAIKCVNTSSTDTYITIKDATSGTNRDVIPCPSGKKGDGIIYPMPLAQASAANNWTATGNDSVASLQIFVQARKRK